MKHNHYLVVGVLVSLALGAQPVSAQNNEQGTATPGTVTPGTVTPGTVTPGTVTAVAAGRHISAASVGRVSIDVAGSKATVHLDDHRLEVEKERLLLDGVEQAAVPAATAKIEIEVKDEMLTVKADGKEVLRAKLENKK